MEWLTKLIDINKVPNKIIILVFIVTCLLLFLPDRTLETLSLHDFKNVYGKYFGIGFLISAGLLLIGAITWMINKINYQILKKKYKARIKNSLQKLDAHEKAVLREFYMQGKSTMRMPMDNPTISNLIDKHILDLVGQHGEMSTVGMLFNYRLSDTARVHLTPQLLELPISEPTETDLNRIRDSRPSWIVRLESFQRLFNT